MQTYNNNNNAYSFIAFTIESTLDNKLNVRSVKQCTYTYPILSDLEWENQQEREEAWDIRRIRAIERYLLVFLEGLAEDLTLESLNVHSVLLQQEYAPYQWTLTDLINQPWAKDSC
jgi:hypothetical protein